MDVPRSPEYSRAPYNSQPRSLSSPLTSPGPSPSWPSQRLLIVATVDAERYTTVDITDSIENGCVIRSRVLNKLGIRDASERAHSLIYETEIGAAAFGPPLTDDALSSICCERADNRASLAFIVERPSLLQRRSEEQLSPRSPDYYADSDSPEIPVRDATHTQPRRYLWPSETSQLTAPGNNEAGRLHSRQNHVIRPPNVTIESQGGGGNSDGPTPRRAVRPLPALPTPTLPSSPGPPLSGGSYRISPVVNEIDDLYDYVPPASC